jgi:hypothetical protein
MRQRVCGVCVHSPSPYAALRNITSRSPAKCRTRSMR